MDETREEYVMNNPQCGLGLSRQNASGYERDDEGELRLEGRLLRDEISNGLWTSGYRRSSSSIPQSSNTVEFEVSSNED